MMVSCVFFNNCTAQESEQESNSCDRYNVGFTVALLIYSIVILFLYSLLQRRTNKFQTTCAGYFGIPVPVNLIHETKDRWVYAAAFGALAGQFVSLALNGSGLESASYIANIWRGIALVGVMMIYPLGFFALFASIHGVAQILSQIVGLVYILLLFINLGLTCKSCDDAIMDDIDIVVLRRSQRAVLLVWCVINSICYAIIGGFFIWRGVQSVVYLILGKPFPPQHTINHHIGHVKRIFNRAPKVPSNKVFAVIQLYLYQWDPYFKYSVRILSVAVVITIALFTLTFEMINLLVLLSYVIEELLKETSLDVHLRNAIAGLSYLFSVLVPLVSFSIVFLGYISSLATYRRYCRLLWKGDRSFIPGKRKKPFARTLTSSIRYFGVQIGMVIWAWIIYTLILLILLFVIIIFIVTMVVVEPIRVRVLHSVAFFIATFVMGIFIYYTLYFTVKCFFAKGNKAHVDNWRFFHFFTFFFLFYYALVGLFKTIQRVLISAAVNLFYLSRLDTALTIKGWEWLDKGYLAYTGLVVVDSIHNNPVMNVFVYLLSLSAERAKRKPVEQQLQHSSVVLTAVKKITTTKYYTDTDLHIPLEVTTSQGGLTSTTRAKKRWQLAYTLVRNPDLIELRRRDSIDEKDEESKVEGHANPAYIDDGVELGFPSDKKPTKL
ncbi:stimulated by retinoic acid gene 6 protein-like [Dysidea avara]|uniref:stimulated by retinoic acid gene 6 protein-like n=1 Tax=Dysidea avara TaxID=196820 RepID=UPI0033192429